MSEHSVGDYFPPSTTFYNYENGKKKVIYNDILLKTIETRIYNKKCQLIENFKTINGEFKNGNYYKAIFNDYDLILEERYDIEGKNKRIYVYKYFN